MSRPTVAPARGHRRHNPHRRAYSRGARETRAVSAVVPQVKRPSLVASLAPGSSRAAALDLMNL